MAFVLPFHHQVNQTVRSAPRCSERKPAPNASHVLRVAAAGVVAAGMIAGANVVQAIELPQLPLPSLPSVPMPGLPDMPKLGGEQPKDSQTNLTDEEEGKMDDMMSRLEAKKRARAAKM